MLAPRAWWASLKNKTEEAMSGRAHAVLSNKRRRVGRMDDGSMFFLLRLSE